MVPQVAGTLQAPLRVLTRLPLSGESAHQGSPQLHQPLWIRSAHGPEAAGHTNWLCCAHARGIPTMCSQMVLPALSAECQLLAELRMHQLHQPSQPILGLLVDPTNMSLYLPVARSSFQYRAVTRPVRDVEKTMDTLDIIFAYMRQFEAEIPLSPHDVQGSTLRLITGRVSATEACLDQVSAQLEEVTARLEWVPGQLEELKK